MLDMISRFTWRDGLFSVKTFAAAMLALYIAFRLNLSQPSWSVTTVYVVSQPFAGMVLAKSFYRVLGTLIGAVMSLVFVSLFSNSPTLFCIVLALWIGAGTSFTIYLRDAPQAYAGMLAGYSAAIIGLPAALAPNSAFDFAVARCLEIMLGIACGTLMHHVVFPQRAGDALRKILATTLPNMARWADDALRDPGNDAKSVADRRQIIATVVGLDALRVFSVLDTPAMRAIDSTIRQFEGKLLSLLALFVSLYDRFGLLRHNRPAAAETLQPLLTRAAAHMSISAEATTPRQSHENRGTEAALLADINQRLPSPQKLRTDPDAFLTRSILLRLRDILEMWHEAVVLRTYIASGIHPPGVKSAPTLRPYRDVVFALVGGAISASTVLIASAFWILTAWPNGPTAVTFAGIICAIMGARDDPASAAATFLKMSVVGAVIAGIYLFAVLPGLSTFPALVIALAPFYLACSLFMTASAAAPLILPMIFIGGGLIGVSNAMTYDFAAYLNNFISYIVGIGIGAVALGLLRPLGAEWTVQRLTRGIMVDLERIAGAATPQSRSAFESRMFDRINALLMRLDPLIDDQRAAMQGGLASLRVGLNILAIRRLRPLLPPAAAKSVNEALAALTRHFRHAAAGRPMQSPLPLLEASRHHVLSLDDSAGLTQIAEALYNMENTLRQHADFFGLHEPLPLTALPTAVTG